MTQEQRGTAPSEQQDDVQVYLKGGTKRSLVLCASSTEAALFPSKKNKVTILKMVFL